MRLHAFLPLTAALALPAAALQIEPGDQPPSSPPIRTAPAPAPDDPSSHPEVVGPIICFGQIESLVGMEATVEGTVFQVDGQWVAVEDDHGHSGWVYVSGGVGGLASGQYVRGVGTVQRQEGDVIASVGSLVPIRFALN